MTPRSMPHPQTLRSLAKCTTQSGPISGRAVTTDILKCRLLRVAGDTDPTLPSVKINVSYGVLLRHSTSGRLRYFHASTNNATMFPVARTISNRADLNQLLETFEGVDRHGFYRMKQTSHSTFTSCLV